jgi:hypothetical protein
MSESQIRIDVGTPPWAPAADARVVEEYDRHDFPLSGVLEQGGIRYLFKCLLGQMDRASIWAYVPITADEERAIEDLRGDAVLDAIDHLLTNRMLTMAGAGDLHVFFAARIDAGIEDQQQVIGRFLKRWDAYTDEQRSAVTSASASATQVLAGPRC